jgi:UDP-N-acetylglucosamine 2-epimerase (non-hydrolysing)
MSKPRIVCTVGTRPDAIKMAPVIQELRRFEAVETVIVSTGQHREMLAQALGAFGLAADFDLEIMQHGQTLAQITSRALEGLDRILAEVEPAWVVGQGDTTTTFCASLAAFYRQVPFAHVEAGLRTESVRSPFPEEFNRRASGLIADWHFAPTQVSADNLRREGKPEADILVTGNTGIDAVLEIARRETTEWFPEHAGRVILLTTHRRENLGEPQRAIARAARQVLDQTADAILVVPMHRNPAVRETLVAELGDHPRVRLIEPPDYAPFVKLLQRATLVLTDSGGIQEEAPSFGIPVLVLRQSTERPEGITAGVAKLVGTDEALIVRESLALLGDEVAFNAMAKAQSPYGDGHAAQRIRRAILDRMGMESHGGEDQWVS